MAIRSGRPNHSANQLIENDKRDPRPFCPAEKVPTLARICGEVGQAPLPAANGVTPELPQERKQGRSGKLHAVACTWTSTKKKVLTNTFLTHPRITTKFDDGRKNGVQNQHA